MTTDEAIVPIDRNERQQQKSPWTRVGALVGAGALVIVAVAGIAFLRSGSDTVAAPPYATAEEAAQATAKAINLGDWDAYRAAFSDDATNGVSWGRAIGDNEEVAEARFNQLVLEDVNVQVESCTALTDHSASCRVSHTDVYLEALSGGPSVAYYTYGIDDGLLVFRGQATDWEPLPVMGALFAWAEDTNNAGVEHRFDTWAQPVGQDPTVAVAGMREAVDEFLAQYNG